MKHEDEIKIASNKPATAIEIPHGYPSDPIGMIHEIVAYSPKQKNTLRWEVSNKRTNLSENAEEHRHTTMSSHPTESAADKPFQ